MSTSPTTQIVEVGMDEVKELIDRARRSPLSAEECQLLMDLAVSYVSLTQMLKDRGTTIDRLRKLVFGSPNEKTRDVLGTDPGQGTAAPADAPKAGPRPGHGRNGADAYSGAQRIKVEHASLRSGTCCPKCPKGKLYPLEPV